MLRRRDAAKGPGRTRPMVSTCPGRAPRTLPAPEVRQDLVAGYRDSRNHVRAIARLTVGGSADSSWRGCGLILTRTCFMVVPFTVR